MLFPINSHSWQYQFQRYSIAAYPKRDTDEPNIRASTQMQGGDRPQTILAGRR